MLAVFDAEGRRVGTKPRDLVHADNDWHWIVFVWCVLRDPDGRKCSILQIRGRPDDPRRTYVDAPAGGHVAAGEAHLEGAIREFREEAGVLLEAGELAYLGTRRIENPTGLCRRAIQHFYLSLRPLGLADLVPGEEVLGFVEAAIDDLIELLDNRVTRIPARARYIGSVARIRPAYVHARSIAYEETVLDGFRRSLVALDRFLDTGIVTPIVC